MTNQQKHDLKESGKSLVRWLVLLLGIGWVTWQCAFIKPAQALNVMPSITSFTYTTPSGVKMETVSWWTDNHIKCTMTRPFSNYSTNLPVGLSCVTAS